MLRDAQIHLGVWCTLQSFLVVLSRVLWLHKLKMIQE